MFTDGPHLESVPKLKNGTTHSSPFDEVEKLEVRK